MTDPPFRAVNAARTKYLVTMKILYPGWKVNDVTVAQEDMLKMDKFVAVS
jgi:hypothetical protein